MQHGFLKLAAVTPRITVAGCAQNAAAIKDGIARAEQDGARLVALPALCLTGYTCGDLMRLDALLHAALEALEDVLCFTKGRDTLIVLGAPLSAAGALYNCAIVLQNGRILGVAPTSGQSSGAASFPSGLFASAPVENSFITLLGQRVPFGNRLLFCCEELPAFVLGVEVQEDIFSPQPLAAQLSAAGATVICGLSAIDEAVLRPMQRRTQLAAFSARQICAYALTSAGDGESTSNAVFSGHNLIYENGALLAEAAPFQGGYAVSEIDLDFLLHERRRCARPLCEGFQRIPFSLFPAPAALTRACPKLPFVPAAPALLAERCDEVAAIQAHALMQRIRHTRAKTLVLGVSGGVDSTLALLVCRDALRLLGRPVTDIIAVTMPCFGTSHRTRDNAELLCEALGLPLRTINISAAVTQHLQDLGHAPALQDTAFENAQARERTQVLMDLANMESGLVIGTGDLSELALGFATYNGDHMSMYGVNAGVPKTLIRAMLLHEAGKTAPALASVLRDIVATPVSPELLPGTDGAIAQITEELVGPYELHDFFLYHLIRRGETPDKILRLAAYAFRGDYDADTIAHWYGVFCRRFVANQFKRSCSPDGPRVGSVSLAPGDWHMPSDAVFFLFHEKEKEAKRKQH